MKRFLRLALLAAVLAGLAAWLKELVAGAEPPPQPQPESTAGSATGNGGAPTREQLYEEAQRLGIEGRSKMNKGELEAAVRAARS
jgi:hypothetical protein